MMCAGIPEDLVELMQESNLNQVSLKWDSAINNGGSPLVEFRVFRDGALIGVVDAVVEGYTDPVEYNVEYVYKVLPVNWVGTADGNTLLSVNVTEQPDPETTEILKPVGLRSQYEFTVSVNLKDSAGADITSGELMLLEFKNQCEVNSGYDCEIISKIIEETEYVEFASSGTGTMAASYTPALDGIFTLSVIQLHPRSIRCDLWDNIWFYDNVDKVAYFDSFSISYAETDLITTYASNFISAKCFAMVMPLSSETYTFFIEADDGVRLYINDVLVIDKWDTCCQEFEGTYDMLSSKYYSIELDYKQLEGSASFSLK